MKRFSVVLMALAVLAPAGVTLAVPIPALAQGREGTGLGPAQVRALRVELSVAISGLTNARGAAAAADRREAISRANLAEVGRLLGLTPSTPPSDIVDAAERWVESYQTVVQQLDETRQVLARTQSGEVRTAGDHYLQLAQAALAEGQLAAADEAFAQLETVLQTARREVEDFAVDPTAARVALAWLQDEPLRAAELADADYDRRASERARSWTRAMEAGSAYLEADRRASAVDGNRWLLLAIERYRDRALRYVDRTSRPDDWASTQNDLGIALQTLGARESGTARLEEAVVAYQAALQETTRERVPLDWALIQSNLGAAHWALGNRTSSIRELQAALAAYENALSEFTRDRAPLQWAMIQYNVGVALLSLEPLYDYPPPELLEKALAALEASLLERTRERVPLDWARSQNSLCIALSLKGRSEDSRLRFQAAVEACDQALLERTRERVPLEWAETKNNLGNALTQLGRRVDGTAELEAAVVAYREALSESTRDRVPLVWAQINYNIGGVLSTIGERVGGKSWLEAAVAAYDEALLERTRERLPLEFARTSGNKALALASLFDVTGSIEYLDRAIASANLELEVFDRVGSQDDYYRSRRRVDALESQRAALP